MGEIHRKEPLVPRPRRLRQSHARCAEVADPWPRGKKCVGARVVGVQRPDRTVAWSAKWPGGGFSGSGRNGLHGPSGLDGLAAKPFRSHIDQVHRLLWAPLAITCYGAGGPPGERGKG